MTINEENLRKSAQEASDIWMDSLPSEDDLSEPEWSEGFEDKMQKQFRRKHRRKSHLWRYVAAAAAVVLIVSAVVVPFPSLVTGGRSAKEVDFTDPNEIYALLLDLTYFSYSKLDTDEMTLAKLEANYIPENMEWTASLEDAARFSRGVCYASKDAETGQYFVISQQLATENEDYVLLVDTDQAEQKKVKINGIKGTLYLEDNLVSIVWELVSEQENTYVLVINGTLSQEELLKVAEGITLSSETTGSDSDNEWNESMVCFSYLLAGKMHQLIYSNGQNFVIDGVDVRFYYGPEDTSNDENTNTDNNDGNTYADSEYADSKEELMEQIQSLQIQIENLELQMQDNKEMLDELTMQLEDLTAVIVSLEAEGDASEEVVLELKAQQESVEESIASQEELLATINETIESLQEQLEGLAG